MKNSLSHICFLACFMALCGGLPAQAEESVHTNHKLNDLYNGSEPMPPQGDTFVVCENESSDGLWHRPAAIPPARPTPMPGSVLNGTPGAAAYGDVLNGRVKDTTPKPVPASKDLGQGDRDLHQRMEQVGKHN